MHLLAIILDSYIVQPQNWSRKGYDFVIKKNRDANGCMMKVTGKGRACTPEGFTKA